MTTPIDNTLQPYPSLKSPDVGMLAAKDQAAQINRMNLIKGQNGGDTIIKPPVAPYGGPAAALGSQAYVNMVQNSNQFKANSVMDSAAMNATPTPTGGSKRRRRWSNKYKKSINCKRPKGFSQRQHCKYGRKRTKRRQTKRR